MNRFLRPTLTFLCCLAGCAPRLAAQDDEPGRARSESPYFQVLSATEPGVDALPLKDTQVDVTIAGMIAEVAVVQTYTNEGSVPLEAKYVFPGSTRAAVHGLTMVIGDRVVRAKIQQKAEARRTYEAAKAAGKTTTLLEQQRPNVFEMNLANILPGDEIRVELRYTELLVPEDGEYAFVYPTVVGPRYVGDRRALSDESAGAATTASDSGRPAEPWTATAHLPPGEAPRATFGLTLDLAAGVPIAQLACATHAVRIVSTQADRASLTLDPSVDPASHANRDVIVRYRIAGDAVHAGLITSRAPGAEEGYFLAMIQPPARVEPAAIPPRDYVFIVDVSGSMHGFPLQTTRQLLTDLIAALRPTDTFNVVLFAGSAATLSSAPVAATPENLARAIVLLERQQAGGGTELLPALKSALALPRPDGPLARTFVVVTDGFIAVEAEAFALVRQNLDRANVFAFGIGASVNRHLIEGLARAGQGEPFVVTSAGDATASAARFRAMIESPVLTGVSVAFDGVIAADVTPYPVPDVFAQRPVVLYGRWRGAPTGRLRLAGLGGAGGFATSLDFAQAASLDGSRVLELLWARAQVRALEDDELEGRDPDRISAITQLGLRHGLLTQHTSFVAVDEVVRNPAASALPVKQPVPLPQGVSPSAVGGQAVATTPEPASVGIVFIALAALGWAWWRMRRDGVREAA
ncbi:MAG: VWA domain-containing protein [Opitutaceae bacterium]|nr:VWA domain-containing protein [Opitutaceae bacterium]